MPDLPDQSPLQNWTPERIRETLAAEHNVNWAPPAAEDTWKEDQVDSADEWVIFDQETKTLRALSPDELFDLTDAVQTSSPQLDLPSGTVALDPLNWGWKGDPEPPVERELAGYPRTPDSTAQIMQDIRYYAEDVFPRDHPQTDREMTYVQEAMKEHGASAEHRAQARWEARMNPGQSQAQAMARATHHPSALRPIRPSVS